MRIGRLTKAASPTARVLIVYLPGVASLIEKDFSAADELALSGFPVISLADTLDGLALGDYSRLTFEMDGHYNARIHKAIGEKLATELRRRFH